MQVPVSQAEQDFIKKSATLSIWRRNFNLFAQQALYIQTKEQGLIQMRLREYQKYLSWIMVEQEKQEGLVRQIWLKSRQLGTSTLSQAKIFHRTALNPNVKSLVVAHDLDTTKNIFQMAGRFYQHMPEFARPLIRYSTKTELTFDTPVANRFDIGKTPTTPQLKGLGSELIVKTAKNIHSGAGYTLHNLHLSEAARYQNAIELESSLMPAVGYVKGTMIVIESTAHPEGIWFHEMCEMARENKSAFHFEFIGWDMDPTCVAIVHPGEMEDLSEDEKDYKKHFNLSLGQLKWRRLEIANKRGDVDQFNQEFPLTYESAWVSKKLAVWPIEQLAILQRGVRAPLYRADILDKNKLMKSTDGSLEVWEEPKPGLLYDIGVDTSMGLSDSKDADWSVANVNRRDTDTQVALLRAQCDPTEFAFLVECLGWFYNTAQINIELNHASGYFINAKLSQESNYPNLYIWRIRDNVTPKLSSKTGWVMDHKHKRYIVSLGKDRVYRYCTSAEKDTYPLVRSEVLLREMGSFVKLDASSDTYGGAHGSHDDVTIAWLLTIVAANDEKFGGGMTSIPVEEKRITDYNDPRIWENHISVRMTEKEARVATYQSEKRGFPFLTGWNRGRNGRRH